LEGIILAADPRARVRIAGLTAVERACRVARRAGADRVLVVDGDRAGIASWHAAGAPILVVQADQLVHTPLVADLVKTRDDSAIAVVPDAPAVDDLTPGAFAGALVAHGDSDRVIAALVDGKSLDEVVTSLSPAKIPHGAIARAPLRSPAEIKAAHALLYKILIKPQDNAITRYVYRPVSFPLTRLLAHTPITPNQISYGVALFVAIGCWLTAHASHAMAFAGTATILAGSYLDCCDGEIARLKLLSSKYGAWIDTIVDELSSVGYMAALGWHCHLAYGPGYLGDLGFDPWTVGIVIGVITYGASIYFVYYNIIVAVGSANSQDYVGRFDVVPGSQPNARRLAPASTKAIAPKKPLPPWLAFVATYLPYIVRRDFISWGATVLAAVSLTQVSFGTQLLGGVITSIILGIDHVRLRALRRSIIRAGQVLESPSR
jgi:phosphatidylglycerophosphate synthase